MDASDDRLSIQTNKPDLRIDDIIKLYFSVPSANGYHVNDPGLPGHVGIEYQVTGGKKLFCNSPFRTRYELTAVFDFDNPENKIMHDYLKKNTAEVSDEEINSVIEKLVELIN